MDLVLIVLAASGFLALVAGLAILVVLAAFAVLPAPLACLVAVVAVAYVLAVWAQLELALCVPFTLGWWLARAAGLWLLGLQDNQYHVLDGGPAPNGTVRIEPRHVRLERPWWAALVSARQS